MSEYTPEPLAMLRAETLIGIRERTCRAFDLEPSEQWLLRPSPVDQDALDAYAAAHCAALRAQRDELLDLLRGADHLLCGEKYYSEFAGDDQIALWRKEYARVTAAEGDR